MNKRFSKFAWANDQNFYAKYINFKQIQLFFRSYGTDAYLIYPTWTTVIAMLMTFAPFAPIPIYFVYAFLTKGSSAFIPEDSWERSEGLENIEPGIENYTYHGERATSFRRNGSYRRRVENNPES